MKPLSEQLTELAARAKRSEDFVNAANAKNRAYLDDQRETLKKSIATGKAQMSADAAVTQDKTRTWWNDTRQSIDARVAELRAERDDHRAAHDLKKAERRAEDAEEDAAYAVDFALQMLDEAEYAVADATLARIDADELAASEPA
jgi:vacuolar-type H+-ATPase subunit I/STV1